MVYVMREGRTLTSIESKALFELVSNQKDSDKAIAEKMGMAPSNFAVVKKRLQEKGMLLEHIRINPHRIPEVKVAAFVWIEYNKPIRGKFEKELAEVRRSFPHAYTHGSPDWSLNVSYYPSFEAAENARLRMADKLFTSDAFQPLISNHMWKILPISHMAICDFKTRFIAQATGHELKEDTKALFQRCQYPVVDQLARLNDTEKRVLIALRKYPEMKKKEIAERVGLQQSSLSEVFKTLQKKGVISYIRTIEPRLLPGSEVATFTWIDMRRPVIGDLQKCVEEIAARIPEMYHIHYTRTFMLIESLFTSLDKAESANTTLLDILGENVKTLNFKTVPCVHLTTSHHAYFLEQIFGMSV